MSRMSSARTASARQRPDPLQLGMRRVLVSVLGRGAARRERCARPDRLGGVRRDEGMSPWSSVPRGTHTDGPRGSRRCLGSARRSRRRTPASRTRPAGDHARGACAIGVGAPRCPCRGRACLSPTQAAVPAMRRRGRRAKPLQVSCVGMPSSQKRQQACPQTLDRGSLSARPAPGTRPISIRVGPGRPAGSLRRSRGASACSGNAPAQHLACRPRLDDGGRPGQVREPRRGVMRLYARIGG